MEDAVRDDDPMIAVAGQSFVSQDGASGRADSAQWTLQLSS